MDALPQLALVATAMLLSLLACAVVSDCCEQRIPNWITAAVFALGMLLQFVEGSWLSGLAGACVGLLMLLPLYVAGGMGAGDVKLLAASGAWLGPVGLLFGFAVALVAGLVMALCVLLVRSRTTQSVLLASPLGRFSANNGNRLVLPYALPLVTGVMFGAAWSGRLTEFFQITVAG